MSTFQTPGDRMGGVGNSDVFELLPVLPAVDGGKAKIRALDVFGTDYIYVGTDDGRVLLHMRQRAAAQRPTSPSAARGHARANTIMLTAEDADELNPFVLVKERFLGHKRDVEQLQVFGDLNRVICRVAGGYVDVLHMMTLDVLNPGLPLSKNNVSLFVAEKGTPLYRIAVFTHSTKLSRSKLHLFEFTSSAAGFTPVREPIDFPDGVFSAQFFRGILCLGFHSKTRKEYRLLNVDTLQETELFPLEGCKAPPYVQVVGEELLLVRDELGLFIDGAGQIVTSHNNIVWSNPPSVVGFKDPYLMSLQEKGKCFEVHNILTQQLIQTIPFPMKNMRFIVGTEQFPWVLLASNTSVFCANKKSTERQIEDLIALKKTKEAILLAEYALQHAKPSADADVDPRETALLRLLQTLDSSGNVLFQELDLAGAFSCWQKVLPTLVSQDSPSEEETILAGALRRRPSASRWALDPRTIIARFPTLANALQSGFSRGPVPLSIREAVKRKLRITDDDAPEIRKSEDQGLALLESFLRTFVSRAVVAQQSPDQRAVSDILMDEPLICDAHTALILLALRPGVRDLESAERYVSGILKSCFGPPLDINQADRSLVRLPYHVQVVEEILRQRRNAVLLGVLFAQQGHLKEALELWRGASELANAPVGVRTGCIREASAALRNIVANLSSSSAQNYSYTQLLWEHAVWVLEASGPTGVNDTFCPPASALGANRAIPSRAVSEFLAGKFGDAYLLPFLEHQVTVLSSPEADFHTQLIKLLVATTLQELAAESYSQNKQLGADAGQSVDKMRLRTPTRVRLLRLLQESAFYVGAQVQLMLAGTPLVPELVVVLSKQSEHRSALELLVWRLRDFPAAEHYCTAHKHEDAGLTLALFKVYLHDTGDSKIAASDAPHRLDTAATRIKSAAQVPERAIRLLLSHARELAVHEVLNLLPDDMPLGTVEEYLRRSITHSHSTANQSRITANLLKADDIGLRAQLAVLQNRRLYIDEHAMCPICHKRIGNTVFARYPNGTVIHFRCQGPNPSIDPVTGADFSNWRTREQYFDEQ